MDNIDINNIRYLQVLIPKLDDSNIDSPRQDYGNINEQLLDSMMSGLLEDDSSMELPPSMTGNTLSKHADKNENKKKHVKKHSCPVCKRTFKDTESLQHHSNASGHQVSSKTATKRMNKCLTCGQRFKDKETMSFHCAARGHVDPNENRYTPKSKNRNPATSTVRKKPIGKQQKVLLQCSECSRRFKDTEALHFHYVMSGHENNNEKDTYEDNGSEQNEEENETKTIAVTKLPCGGCNKKFKDCKSLDLHLALSGHSDKRENLRESKVQQEKRQSDKKQLEKRQFEKKQSEKKQSEKKQSEKKKCEKKLSDKKQSEKRQSEINGRTKSSTGDSEDGNNCENLISTDSTNINCSGCRKKFKSISELQMHCALSGHTQNVVIEKKKSTTSTMKTDNGADSQVKKELQAKVLKNGRSQNKEQRKSRNSDLNCFECGKKFKTLEMLNYHEAFSGHATREESDSIEEKICDEEDDNSSGGSDVEQILIVKEEALKMSSDILCSVCNRKFKDKNALYYHMAISGHGASKLGSDRAVKVKPRSRIADLTSSDSSSDESDVTEESEDDEPTDDARNAKSISKPRCATCKKHFKDTNTLEYHIALSGHSNSATKKKRGRPAKKASCKRTATADKCDVKKKRGRPKKVQILDEESEESSSDQKRQCKECGRKCKDLHAFEYHCAMTGHASTAVISLKKMDLSSCKRQEESEDSESTYDSSNKKPARKKQRTRIDSSDDDSDYEGAGKVRSYQSFMDEASVWDKWNPKKGIPCRRCGLLFKRTEDLKRHLLTTSHKTNVFE